MSFISMSDCVRSDIHNKIKGFDSVNTRPKRMFCHECNDYTKSIEPIIIRRYNTYVFAILSKCDNCNKLKQCPISDEHHIKFPSLLF